MVSTIEAWMEILWSPTTMLEKTEDGAQLHLAYPFIYDHFKHKDGRRLINYLF